MNKYLVLGVAVVVIAGAAIWALYSASENPAQDKINTQLSKNTTEDTEENNMDISSKTHTSSENPIVTLATSEGDIKLELFLDKMPKTAGNFVKLAKDGFYNGTKFHRVISGFMIQGGDPNTKTDNVDIYGTGGPGYTIEDEFVEGLYNYRGTISMANTGRPNSGGSQFFINLVDNNFLDFDKQPLQSKHPVFGRVIEGMDVVDAIAELKTNNSDLPVEPVIIHEVIVEE